MKKKHETWEEGDIFYGVFNGTNINNPEFGIVLRSDNQKFIGKVFEEGPWSEFGLSVDENSKTLVEWRGSETPIGKYLTFDTKKPKSSLRVYNGTP